MHIFPPGSAICSSYFRIRNHNRALLIALHSNFTAILYFANRKWRHADGCWTIRRRPPLCTYCSITLPLPIEVTSKPSCSIYLALSILPIMMFWLSAWMLLLASLELRWNVRSYLSDWPQCTILETSVNTIYITSLSLCFFFIFAAFWRNKVEYNVNVTVLWRSVSLQLYIPRVLYIVHCVLKNE